MAYNSDVDEISRILQEVAIDHVGVMESPPPTVTFDAFGESSLDFLLHFYSKDFWDIEYIKSELRKKIWRTLKEKGVEIPFPQRDIWMRK